MLMLNSLGEDMLFAFLTALVVIILKKQRISCCHSSLAVLYMSSCQWVAMLHSPVPWCAHIIDRWTVSSKRDLNQQFPVRINRIHSCKSHCVKMALRNMTQIVRGDGALGYFIWFIQQKAEYALHNWLHKVLKLCTPYRQAKTSVYNAANRRNNESCWWYVAGWRHWAILWTATSQRTSTVRLTSTAFNRWVVGADPFYKHRLKDRSQHLNWTELTRTRPPSYTSISWSRAQCVSNTSPATDAVGIATYLVGYWLATDAAAN